MGTKALRAITLVVVLAVAGTHACGTQVVGGDSESHFLVTCGSRCGGGLVCICGICTRACDDRNGCSEVSRRAECATPSDSSCGVRVCDVSCLSDDACKNVGPAHACIQGRCRDTLVPVEAGAGGSSGTASGADAAAPPISMGAGGALGATPGAGGAPRASLRDAGPCGSSKTYPPPPSPGSAAGSMEIVVAQSDVDFGDSAPRTAAPPTRFRNIGYDLDGICSEADGASENCAVSIDHETVVDGPGGVDNAYGQVIQLARNLLTNFSSETYSATLRDGSPGLLIHVTEYNGLADDDQLRVELMYGARYDAFSPDAVPAWKGNDVFPVAASSVLDNDVRKARAVDARSYVTNGKLVASLGDMTFQSLFPFTDTYSVRLDLNLHAAFFTCDIGATDIGHWGFTLTGCTLAGRLSADDFIHQLWHFPDPLDLNDPKPLCTNSTSYPSFKSDICNLRDVTSSVVTTGPLGLCDALSFGVNFNTVPASLGDVFDATPLSPPCPLGADPTDDSCDGAP